jgi:transaldolase/transaldolase/glucose-6-phosphate isomerase
VKARWVLGGLLELGISIGKVTQQLEDEGVDKFSKSFDKLMATLEKAVQE